MTNLLCARVSAGAALLFVSEVIVDRACMGGQCRIATIWVDVRPDRGRVS
jgi:hypothetical protein